MHITQISQEAASAVPSTSHNANTRSSSCTAPSGLALRISFSVTDSQLTVMVCLYLIATLPFKLLFCGHVTPYTGQTKTVLQQQQRPVKMRISRAANMQQKCAAEIVW
jgi:hypothetical protein